MLQINEDKICENAKKICKQLKKNGFRSWLVGGCVRDLLLGHTPKDFDVVTDATPQQVKTIFKKRCLIIGKRFQISHVYPEYQGYRNHQNYIEVSTLRSNPKNAKQSINQHGQIERDNHFGNRIEDDVIRRDFTINAIYYDLNKSKLHDLVGSIADLESKKIVTIGKPDTRFREDPVRMLRAVRFKAKLNFKINAEEKQSIASLAPLLRTIPPARLLDESLKLLQTGHGVASYKKLRQFDLFKYLFPITDDYLNQGTNHIDCDKLLILALKNTDTRFANQVNISAFFILSILLWFPFQHKIEQPPTAPKKTKKKTPKQPPNKGNLTQQASFSVISSQNKILRIPKYWQHQIRDTWRLQPQLIEAQEPQELIRHPKFRAAYDFLCLCAETSQDPQLLKSSNWWTQYQKNNNITNNTTQNKT